LNQAHPKACQAHWRPPIIVPPRGRRRLIGFLILFSFQRPRAS